MFLSHSGSCPRGPAWIITAPMEDTVLLVEDESDVVDLLRYHLRKAGFKVLVENSGSAGLEAVRQNMPDAVVLELDPGLAFGTGSHPTTRLCMEWLEAHAPAGKTMLDYGCGSGILAMLGKKLGLGSVDGVDID